MSLISNRISDAAEGGRGAAVSVTPPWRRNGIVREIMFVLGIKTVALAGIWWMWFSAPQAEHMRMPQARVQQRLIETPAKQAHDVSQPLQAATDKHVTH